MRLGRVDHVVDRRPGGVVRDDPVADRRAADLLDVVLHRRAARSVDDTANTLTPRRADDSSSRAATRPSWWCRPRVKSAGRPKRWPSGRPSNRGNRSGPRSGLGVGGDLAQSARAAIGSSSAVGCMARPGPRNDCDHSNHDQRYGCPNVVTHTSGHESVAKIFLDPVATPRESDGQRSARADIITTQVLHAPVWLVLLVVGGVGLPPRGCALRRLRRCRGDGRAPGRSAASAGDSAARGGPRRGRGRGDLVGDSVGFEVGRHLGGRVVGLSAFNCTGTASTVRRTSSVGKVAPRYSSRWTAFLRAVMLVLAGMSKMHYPTFLAERGRRHRLGSVGGHRRLPRRTVRHALGDRCGPDGGAAVVVAVVVVVALVVWQEAGGQRRAPDTGADVLEGHEGDQVVGDAVGGLTRADAGPCWASRLKSILCPIRTPESGDDLLDAPARGGSAPPCPTRAGAPSVTAPQSFHGIVASCPSRPSTTTAGSSSGCRPTTTRTRTPPRASFSPPWRGPGSGS